MRRLTKAQKAKNKAAYKAIRKEYEKVKDKAPVSYIQFKRRVKARANADQINLKEAAKKEARTETFYSAGERSRDNLVESLKEKHFDAYKELKNASRKNGKFQKIKENLKWDTDRKGYVLEAGDKSYFVDVTNSPEEVNLVEII